VAEAVVADLSNEYHNQSSLRDIREPAAGTTLIE
jgi:hypothetical protein